MLRECTPEAHRARAFASVGQVWTAPTPFRRTSPAAFASGSGRRWWQAWGVGVSLDPAD